MKPEPTVIWGLLMQSIQALQPNSKLREPLHPCPTPRDAADRRPASACRKAQPELFTMNDTVLVPVI